MKSNSILRVLAFILLAVWGSGVEGVRNSLSLSYNVPAIFAFGDSLVDSGTNLFIKGSNTTVDYLPYGQTYFGKPTGRFTDGRHVFDFFAFLTGLPFMPPFLKPGASFETGANFGSGGSGILPTTGGSGVVSLGTQVKQFQNLTNVYNKRLGLRAATQLISNSLFFVNAGGNDFSAYLTNTTLQQTVTPQEYIEIILTQLREHIKTLYSSGARKLVVFAVGPLGCVPRVMALFQAVNGRCVAQANELVRSYNTAFAKVLLDLSLRDLKLLLANPFDIILSLVTNGNSLGFTEGSKACCGSGAFNGVVQCGPINTTYLCDDVSKFVFWDFIHPTDRVNSHLAELLWNGEPSIIRPNGVEYLALV